MSPREPVVVPPPVGDTAGGVEVSATGGAGAVVPDDGFVSVSLGRGFGCGLQAGGDVACWGGRSSLFCVEVGDGQAECTEENLAASAAPAGKFVAVDAGSNFACGVRVGGVLECWGRLRGDVAGSPPAGKFVAVDAGVGPACGIRVGGEVECWVPGLGGVGWPSDVPVPEGAFSSVSVGGSHVCGVRVGGEVACWSAGAPGWGSPRNGLFSSVSAGLFHTCGIRVDATVACWGDGEFGRASPAEGEFVSVSAGGPFSCGVRTGGDVACWGLADRPGCGSRTSHPRSRSYGCKGWDLYPGFAPEGPFTAVGVTADMYSFGTICALRQAGELACWNDESVVHRPPVGSFVALDGVRDGMCGVRVGGAVVCWGEAAPEGPPPQAGLRSVSVGARHGCGLRSAGAVVCWGDGARALAPPEGRFEGVGVGEDFACGLRSGGTVLCWGLNLWWRASAPPGVFVAVSVAARFACALRAGGEAVCWGDDLGGQVSHPGGVFVAVTAADRYACGMRAGGEVACWGSGAEGLGAPGGEFVALDAKEGHLCGLRPGGAVDCWHRIDATWRHHSPPGTFAEVAVSRDHACGIRSDGSLECWSPLWPPGAGMPVVAAAAALDPGMPRAVVAPEPTGRGVPDALAWVLGDLPAGPFGALDAGYTTVCGLRPDGTVVCWGRAEASETCRSDSAGEITCPPLPVEIPEGFFEQIAVGIGYACGLGLDGMATCWEAGSVR